MTTDIGMQAAIDGFNDLIDRIEARCMAVDGPVTPTLQEIREDELASIWRHLQTIRSAPSSPATPSPVSAPAGEVVEALRDAWSFLQDRLLEFEQEIGSGDEEREWAGHVMPALSRFGSLIAALNPAPGHGEGVPADKCGWPFCSCAKTGVCAHPATGEKEGRS